MRRPWAAVVGMALIYAGLLVADTRPPERFELDLRVNVGSRANKLEAQVLRILSQRARASSRWGTPLYAQFSIPESESSFLFVAQGTTIPDQILTILQARDELMWGAEGAGVGRRFSAIAPSDGVTRTLCALRGPAASEVTSTLLTCTDKGPRLIFTLAESTRGMLDLLAHDAGDRSVAVVVGGFDLGRVSPADLTTARRIVVPLDGLTLEAQAALAGLLRDPAGTLPPKVKIEEMARVALRGEKVRSDLAGRIEQAQVDPEDALRDGSPLVRAAVAQSLWRIAPARRKALEATLAHDPDPEVQMMRNVLPRSAAAPGGGGLEPPSKVAAVTSPDEARSRRMSPAPVSGPAPQGLKK